LLGNTESPGDFHPEALTDPCILFGEGFLRKAIREFVDHYQRERNHQGLGNRLIIEEESLTPEARERSRDRSGWAEC